MKMAEKGREPQSESRSEVTNEICTCIHKNNLYYQPLNCPTPRRLTARVVSWQRSMDILNQAIKETWDRKGIIRGRNMVNRDSYTIEFGKQR